MHDAAVVRVGQRVGQVQGVPHRLPDRQRLARQTHVQPFAFDQFHGDVGLAGGFAHVVDRADVRVIQLGGRTRLLQQPRARRRVREAPGGQHL